VRHLNFGLHFGKEWITGGNPSGSTNKAKYRFGNPRRAKDKARFGFFSFDFDIFSDAHYS